MALSQNFKLSLIDFYQIRAIAYLKKIKYKVFVLFLTFNFISCNPINCDIEQKYFNIEGLEINVKKILTIYNDGSISTQPFDTNTSIEFSNFALEIIPKVNYYGKNSNTINLGNLFINSAIAGKCPPPGSEGSTEQISDFLIFSNNPFIASGSISDTLSQFFNISGIDQQSGFVKPVNLAIFKSNQPNVLKTIILTLNTEPTGLNEHKFTIRYKQTNGEEYELTTPIIKFK